MHSAGRVASVVAVLALAASVGLVGCSSAPADPGAAAIAAASADSEVPAPDAPVRVGNEAFLAVVESPNSVLIDVRTPKEFGEGHIETAVNYDASSPDFAKQIAALDRAITYAIYCQDGPCAQSAVDQMQKAGLEHLYVLDKGLDNWVDEAFPVVYQ